jgi:glycolate oxidase
MADFWNLHELVETARRQLSRNEWDFIVGASETETTLRRNRFALDSLALRPRVLRNVSDGDRSSMLFGRKLRLPLIMAPIGKQEYHGGAATVARVAQKFGCAFALSSVNAMTKIEDVAAAAPEGANLYQLYVRGDREWIDGQLARALAADCFAFCVTVDTTVISRRERDFANRFTSQNRRRFEGDHFQAAFDWTELTWLRDRWKRPLVVKGITTAEDAERALSLGIDGIYVSNHGGRQLDHMIGAIDGLREVAAVAAGKATLMVDGGFVRGTDILKGIASGAAAVGIGRLHCLALAAAGEEGLTRMFELLEDELQIAMALSGIVSLQELDASYLREVRALDPYTGALDRAFPLLHAPREGYR